ncbi:MAG: hypothetical protein RL154_1240, partial [Pseudomonadota bacterium]
MIIKNALIIDENGSKNGSLRIEDGKIVQIDNNLEQKPNETVIDASGLWVLPGAVDLNVGLGDGANIAPT